MLHFAVYVHDAATDYDVVDGNAADGNAVNAQMLLMLLMLMLGILRAPWKSMF